MLRTPITKTYASASGTPASSGRPFLHEQNNVAHDADAVTGGAATKRSALTADLLLGQRPPGTREEALLGLWHLKKQVLGGRIDPETAKLALKIHHALMQALDHRDLAERERNLLLLLEEKADR